MIHEYFTCPNPCEKPGSCEFCDGGLQYCLVCGLAEGSLTTECPGEHVPEDVEEAIRQTGRDYLDGEWIELPQLFSIYYDEGTEGEGKVVTLISRHHKHWQRLAEGKHVLSIKADSHESASIVYQEIFERFNYDVEKVIEGTPVGYTAKNGARVVWKTKEKVPHLCDGFREVIKEIKPEKKV